MAIFYQTASTITRGTFTCAVATAAYRSGTLLKLNTLDRNQGKRVEHSFDYSTKPGIAFSSILAPAHAPEWVYDRQKLWQTIEDIDSKFNASLAREYTIALPEELTADQNIELVKDFVKNSFVARGMVADVNFHNDHSNNPHLHIMCPTRMLDVTGKKQGFSTKIKEWGSTSMAKTIRKEQADVINKYLKKYGHSSRVSDVPCSGVNISSLRPWL